MKTYMGYNICADGSGPGPVLVVDEAGSHPLNPRYDVRNHSPDGFSWGYGGSGPAQLSLAILCDAIGKTRAERIYQDFKFKVVAAWPMKEPWSINEAQVLQVAERIEQDRIASCDHSWYEDATHIEVCARCGAERGETVS